MNLVFLGPPGVGKGTQAAIIAKELGLVHLSSGDLFRKVVREGGELGRKIKGYQERGELVPDELANALVFAELEAIKDKGVIFDGFPRTLNQAKALDTNLKERGKKLDLVIYFDLPQEELIRRLTSRRICLLCQAPYNLLTSPPKEKDRCDRCGGQLYQREDDREEVVLKRLQVYLTQTAPLLDYYKDRLIFLEANGGIEEVTYNLKRILRGEALGF